MVTIAITGVGGLIGQRLVTALETAPHVDAVLGVDVKPPDGLRSPKLRLATADVRDRALAQTLDGADVVVHLAFQLDPIRDESTMHAVNVDGTRNVFEAARAAGASKTVYVSSGVAYGAHPDNDLPLHEDSPLRANPDFNYAEHKLEVERWLWPWAESHPEMTVTVLRPSIVAGPGVDNFISRQLEMPRFPAVRGHRPPMQFVHVDDVASALAHAVEHDLPGAYNVSSEGWLSFDEVVAVGGRRVLELPEEVAHSAAQRMWRLGIGEAPPGQLNYIMHPWVLSVDKLVATGWRPRHTNRDALAELAREHGEWLTLAGVRTRRAMVRATLAGAGAAGGLALARVALRRRRHRASDATART